MIITVPRTLSGSGRISVKEAAERLNVSQQFVRVAMQQGKLPIGICMKMPKSSTYSYHISPKLLEEYVGTRNTSLSPPHGNSEADNTSKGA